MHHYGSLTLTVADSNVPRALRVSGTHSRFHITQQVTVAGSGVLNVNYRPPNAPTLLAKPLSGVSDGHPLTSFNMSPDYQSKSVQAVAGMIIFFPVIFTASVTIEVYGIDEDDEGYDD